MSTKIHKEVLSKEAYKLLQELQAHPQFKNFRLGGGTALALQIGHRASVDLDFFSGEEFFQTIAEKLPGTYRVIAIADNYIEVSLNDVKVMFMHFAYPLYTSLIKKDGVNYISPVDIGLMKLLALGGRSTRKDIIDLYFIDKEVIPLEDLLKTFHEFYPKDSYNKYFSLKRLLNKEALDAEPMPKLLKKCTWEECYDTISSKIVAYYKEDLDK